MDNRQGQRRLGIEGIELSLKEIVTQQWQYYNQITEYTTIFVRGKERMMVQPVNKDNYDFMTYEGLYKVVLLYQDL